MSGVDVSIIIPSCNGLHLLRPCIDAIRAHTEGRYEVIVVDNGSTDGTGAYCREQRITCVRLPQNEGFPAACNQGIRMATGQELLLLNNDVTVTPGWLGPLRAALNSAPDVGLTGPVTNYASGLQQIEVHGDNMEEFIRIAAERNVPNPAMWQEVKRLVGFCLLMRRSLIQTIGLLDEAYGQGHYEDDDYCYRARQHGYRLLMCEDSLVHHLGSASFSHTPSEQLQELIERNHRLFMDKWKVDPRSWIDSRESR
ncbi:glycosyltransferase family 2 protein [Paenibacillus sp. JX-17]|uniref:Glycosyltransferase family 2 protein n=1 Tax=Paenibacillus lacisoli TaxID=3064525 RepID=A0ABT9CEK9_9BACL|nr:glycosyltransferase family 2 protein [Paenibacillus sp. JX-17]MDO7906998.1 glycosyltransferase family 2 protein [Paenibacillus sp. JX-17]